MVDLTKLGPQPTVLPRPEKPWRIVPKMWGDGHNLIGYTAEAKAAYLAQWEEYAKSVRAWTVWRDSMLAQVTESLKLLGFRSSVGFGKKARGLTVTLGEFFPSGPWGTDIGPPSFHEEERIIKAAAAVNAAVEREQRGRARMLRAHAYLLQQGKKLGVDFEEHDVEARALELAAAPIKDRLLEGGFMGFEGQNCDGPCRGWNGVDRRCECGNRRVGWVVEGDFENPIVYAEAW